jgi:hypothetical protein
VTQRHRADVLLDRGSRDGQVPPAGQVLARLERLPLTSAWGGIIMDEVQKNTLLALVRVSRIVGYDWKDWGRAPHAYYDGIAFCFARMYCRWKAGDDAAAEIARADGDDAAHDALAHYRARFEDLSMSNATAGGSTLRHVYVLLLGLGMRESSGKHCAGRDEGADNRDADTAEAGLFQVSYNLHRAKPAVLEDIQDGYAGRTDFIELFSRGVTCNPTNWQIWGTGHGAEFQELTKKCPAFATEYAAVGLRNGRSHWGPIKTRKAEVVPDADTLLQSVQQFVDANGIVSV